MSKHTPGPWTIQSQDGAFAYIQGDNLIDGKAGQLARVLLTGNDFSEANARLIAAAPELLSAMQAMIADCDFDNGPDGSYGYTERTREAVKQAKAAITKATGGES